MIELIEVPERSSNKFVIYLNATRVIALTFSFFDTSACKNCKFNSYVGF